MQRRNFISITAAAAAMTGLGMRPPFIPGAAIKKKDKITFVKLLEEMSNPASLARWPEIAWENVQVSALNTKHRHNPGFFARKGLGNFVRIEEKGAGEKEWVLMEHQGPGAIVRMWSPNMATDAVMRIYFDGSASPSIEVNMMQFFYGKDFVAPPFAAVRALGGNVYLPIPFKKGCKITVDKNYCDWKMPRGLFYIIQYRVYVPGTRAETFDLKAYRKNSALLHNTGQDLEHPQNNREGRKTVLHKNIAAGQTEEIVLEKGGKAINYLEVKIEAKDLTSALRSTLLKLSFDGKETVDCPVGDFFGSGHGLNPFEDWMRTVDKEGRMFCRWVMPYKKTAKLKLEVTGKEAVKANVSVNYQAWSWDERSMYFHSNWGFDRGIDNRPVPNFNFISIKGKGVYVGDTLSITSSSEGWWGEGMEKISIDGEKFPSQFGTGTEDYYGYAWGKRTIFDAPFHAQPKISEGPGFLGTTVNTRIRSLDAVPFHSSLQLDFEVLTQDAVHKKLSELDYGVATYWYGFADTTGEWIRDPAGMNKFYVYPR